MMNAAFEKAMKLAVLSGLKVALGPAFLETAYGRPERRTWTALALGEMFLDKVGIFPSRSRLPLLIPHTLAGAWVAHESMKRDGEEDPWAAVMGGVVAAGVATVAPMLRKTGYHVLGIPDPVLGIAEDYFALKLGTEAVGMTMEDVAEAARESLEDVTERVRPTIDDLRERVSQQLQSSGAGSM
jgi:hypothetical protein